MPTHEWTLADDRSGGGGPGRRRNALVAVLILAGVVALAFVVLRLIAPGSSGQGGATLGHKTYDAQVECRVNTSGDTGTVTISGTISGDSPRYMVTVEVLDTATKQRIAEQTFVVGGTSEFGGTTPAQAPVGPDGIECRIAKVL